MIRILKLSFYYDEYIDYFYSSHDLSNLNFRKHQKKIFEDRFGWSDSFKEVLNDKEHFIVEEIIVNDYLLQNKWSVENNRNYSLNNWQFEILKEQIKFYKPNIIFINNPAIENKYYELFNSFNAKIISFDGISAHNKNILKYSSLIITCLKSSYNFYKKFNKQVYYMPHGFDIRINQIINKDKEDKYDTIFIGNIKNKHHSNRIDLLNQMILKTDINIWIGDANKKLKKKNLIKILNFKNYFSNLKYFKNYFKTKKIINKSIGKVFGKDMYQLIFDSKVVLNNHIDISHDQMANIRLFESTGLGSCLLTDYKNNLTEFFSTDEIVTYRNNDEAADKIKYLANNPKEAKQIALKGMEKTLKEHTMQARWDKFSKYLLDSQL